MDTPYKQMLYWSRKRRLEILKMRRRGLTYVQIGRELGITPQRVQQIAKAR